MIPMASSIVVPVIANNVRMPNEMNEPLMAMERLTAADSPTVRPRNNGALPMGSAVDRMAGEISVESTVGSGSTFVVTVPKQFETDHGL